MIKSYDFRYKNTLRIYFDLPVGIGSYGIKEDKLEKFYYKFNSDHNYSFKMFKKCWNLEHFINTKIIKTLNCDINDLDWRDDLEIEIHNIDQDKFNDSIIQDLNYKLKELFGE